MRVKLQYRVQKGPWNDVNFEWMDVPPEWISGAMWALKATSIAVEYRFVEENEEATSCG